jgi:hypothetical protein
VRLISGQAVLSRDVHGAQALAHRRRPLGTTLDRGVVRDDHTLGAADRADTGHHPGAERILGAPPRQRAQFEEWAAGVEQVGDPLTRQQLPPRAVPGDRACVLLRVVGSSAGSHLGLQRLDLGERGEHGVTVGGELLGSGVDHRSEYGHELDASVKFAGRSSDAAVLVGCGRESQR